MTLGAFVTGASGFLGSNLVHELHEQGWQIHVLARPSSSLQDIDGVPVTVHRGDITDLQTLRSCMPAQIDAVFHVAASTNVWSGNNAEQERINVDGTRNIITAAVEAEAGRLVHTSSFVTWGFQDTVLNELSERTTASDWICYVRTKHEAEKRVEDAAHSQLMDSVILNPGHILGPGDRHNWSRMIALVNRGKLPGVPPGSGPFADVRQVAKAHIQAFHRGKTGEKYLLGGNIMSFLELIQITGEILGKPVPKRATPAWILKAVARLFMLQSLVARKEPDLTPESAAMLTRNLLCDSSRAQQELDYRFTNVRNLVEETIDWMRGAGLMDQATEKS